MGFIGENKRLLWAAVGAQGATHDSRLLQNTVTYPQLEEGHLLPERSSSLQVLGEMLLTTLRDSSFSFRSWLLKPYKEGTRVPQQRYFYMRLCAARVVYEHAFGMLKGR